MRVVKTLGGEKSLELLYMTEDVEEAGGMMTMVSTLLTVSYSGVPREFNVC